MAKKRSSTRQMTGGSIVGITLAISGVIVLALVIGLLIQQLSSMSLA